MQPVMLYTSSGGFVVRGHIPPFMTGMEAEVILWGSRVFTLSRNEGVPVRGRDGALVYAEAFAVALVITE